MKITSIKPIPAAVVVGVGSFFRHKDGELYVVVSAGPSGVMLVCVNDGERYSDLVGVANRFQMAAHEISDAFRGDYAAFTPVEVVEIIVK